MSPKDTPAQWREWEARADEPGVQALIREAIRRGEIRVLPRPGGGIRIVPQQTSHAPPRDPDRER